MFKELQSSLTELPLRQLLYFRSVTKAADCLELQVSVVLLKPRLSVFVKGLCNITKKMPHLDVLSCDVLWI